MLALLTGALGRISSATARHFLYFPPKYLVLKSMSICKRSKTPNLESGPLSRSGQEQFGSYPRLLATGRKKQQNEDGPRSETS
jgi:hypothetical protein